MTRKLTREDIEKIAISRNHSIVSFENYENVHSEIQIHCKTCSTTWTTTVHKYKNAKKTGCPQCKRTTTSETHKGKVTSPETKRKIGAKASQRPGSLTGKKGAAHPRHKGGVARDLKNPSTEDYNWKTGVRKRCNNTCVVTLEKAKRGSKGFHCHHLNSFNLYVDQRYLLENGVYLKKEVHERFHRLYRNGNNTEEQFADFCMQCYGFDWNQRKKELNLD